MLILLAPSKTMTTAHHMPVGVNVATPHFLSEATHIAEAVRHADNEKVMHASQTIIEKVNVMYQKWGDEKAPSIFAYRGDVYRWFYADTLSLDDLEWAQQHLFILSGLYGAVRPMDEISPYRLEMKAKLPVGKSKDLYGFWGDKVARMIDSQPDQIICNLASDEYAKVVTKYTKKLVITPVFMDKKANGTVGTVPIYSKMMRGVMARWMIDCRIDSSDDLMNFTAQEYHYDAVRSTSGAPVFYREHPKPIRF